MIKIIVDSQELKDKILSESKYIHDLECVNSNKANTLMHIYTNPDLIEVNKTKMSKEEINQLNKSELVDLIYDYWTQLKTQAEMQMKDKENYQIQNFGRLKMLQANKLRNMLHYKLNQNKDERR